MDEETKRRIGGNEAAFRKVNESLRAGTKMAAADRLFPFRCECGVLGCDRLLEMTLPEYEAVREHATRFVLLEGHEIPEAEQVVKRAEHYIVVEKTASAAAVALETDPRS